MAFADLDVVVFFLLFVFFELRFPLDFALYFELAVAYLDLLVCCPDLDEANSLCAFFQDEDHFEVFQKAESSSHVQVAYVTPVSATSLVEGISWFDQA